MLMGTDKELFHVQVIMQGNTLVAPLNDYFTNEQRGQPSIERCDLLIHVTNLMKVLKDQLGH